MSIREPPLHRQRQLRDAVEAVADPMVVMRRVVDQALCLIPTADGATVELADGSDMLYVCASGSLQPHVGTRLAIESSLSGRALRSGVTQHCSDAAHDPRVDLDACRVVGAMSMVCVPLTQSGSPTGVLKIASRQAGAFTDEDVSRLDLLAGFISATLGAIIDIACSAAETLDLSETQAGDRDPVSDAPDEMLMREREAVQEFVANILRPGAVDRLTAQRRIRDVIRERNITMHVQAIAALPPSRLVGVEALARFPVEPVRGPEAWFVEADEVGLGPELQLAAVRAAVDLLPRLPDDVFLALNVGPDALVTGELDSVLRTVDASRIVIELTEHLTIDDYPTLADVLGEIRSRGTRLAIDDIGAGFSSLRHLVQLAPDFVKLDREFTRGIDLDPVRRSLARALLGFAVETGAQIIAEGIETAEEMTAVTDLGISYGQGYLISRPGPPDALSIGGEPAILRSGSARRPGMTQRDRSLRNPA